MWYYKKGELIQKKSIFRCFLLLRSYFWYYKIESTLSDFPSAVCSGDPPEYRKPGVEE